MEKFDICDYGIISDVKEEFISLRAEYPTAKAIKELLVNYEEELQDIDDAPMIYIGVAIGIFERGCKIPEKFKPKVIDAVMSEDFRERFSHDQKLVDEFEKWRVDFIKQVNGEIKTPRPPRKKKYKFDKWQAGDFYRCTYVTKSAEERTIYFYVLEIADWCNSPAPVVNAFVTKELALSCSEEIGEDLIALPAGNAWAYSVYFDDPIAGDTHYISIPSGHVHYRYLLYSSPYEGVIEEITKLNTPSKLKLPVDDWVPPSIYFYGLGNFESVDRLCTEKGLLLLSRREMFSYIYKLHSSVMHRDTDALKAFLEKDTKYLNSPIIHFSYTPLSFVIFELKGDIRKEIVALLLKHGASPVAKNENGSNAFDVAEKCGWYEEFLSLCNGT